MPFKWSSVEYECYRFRVGERGFRPPLNGRAIAEKKKFSQNFESQEFGQLKADQLLGVQVNVCGCKLVTRCKMAVNKLFNERSFASPTLTRDVLVITYLPYMVVSRLRAMCHCPKSARERAVARSRAPNPPKLNLTNLP
jgi:hypothetical protein